MDELRRRIIEVRVKKHLNQGELAERLGISVTALRGIEHGNRKTYATTLYKVERGLSEIESTML